MAHVENPELKT